MLRLRREGATGRGEAIWVGIVCVSGKTRYISYSAVGDREEARER